METTLRDALESAYDEVAEPVETSEPVEETRVRDEAGRFAKVEQETTEALPEVTEPPPATRKAPSSWKKDYWGHWERVTQDPDLAPMADYIEQREAEFAKGVSTYKAEADRGRALVEAVTPYEPVLRQYGLDPAQHVKSLMDAHYALATGSPEQKLQMFAKLATDYGVSLQGLTGNADPQMSSVAQELARVKQQQAALLAFQQKTEAMSAQQQIEAFKVDHPHFEEVRDAMAQILERQQAADLTEAYELAVFRNKDLRELMSVQQTQHEVLAAQKAAAAKKASAVSTKTSSPSTAVNVKEAKTLRDQLSANYDNHVGGRV